MDSPFRKIKFGDYQKSKFLYHRKACFLFKTSPNTISRTFLPKNMQRRNVNLSPKLWPNPLRKFQFDDTLKSIF